MSLIPAFKIAIENAWLLMLPYLLVTYGLCYLIVSKKSALFSWPPYNKKEIRESYLLSWLVLLSWRHIVFSYQ